MKLYGYKCDGCETKGGSHVSFPSFWFRVQMKRGQRQDDDDYVDAWQFCSERCMVARLQKITTPAAPIEKDCK